MYKLIYLGLMGFLFVLLYNLACIAFNVEKRHARAAYTSSKVHSIKKLNPKYMFAKYIKISKFKRDDMDKALFALNRPITPEMYISESLFNSFLFLPIAFLFFILEQKSMAIIILAISLLFFVSSQNKLKTDLAKRRRKIEEEAPTMIRYFMVSLNNTTDIQKIFENYLEIAGYLKRDVQLAVIDFNSMRNNEDNMIRSLNNFDERLNTPIMSDFVTGLINVTKGKNQESYFAMLERELRQLSLQSLNRKAKKIQGFVTKLFYVLVLYFIVLSIAEFGIFIKNVMSF